MIDSMADGEIKEVQQLMIELEDGRVLTYVGPAQILAGDEIKVVDLHVSPPVPIEEAMAQQMPRFDDTEEE